MAIFLTVIFGIAAGGAGMLIYLSVFTKSTIIFEGK
jgi:hypothetical protein